MKTTCLGLFYTFSALTVAAPEKDFANLDLETLMQMEVKVTSQKRLQNISDVPASVIAFSAEDLAAARAEDASALRTLVPGLVFDQVSGFSQVYLRGIGADFYAPGFNHSVAVYVDGIYVPFNQVMDQSFLDVERVEVMKGPQGTLYGRNATAGAINIITRKPPDMPVLEVSAKAMNFNGWGLSGRAAGSITDQLNANLAFEHSTRNAWVRNVQGPGLEDAERRGIRGKLHYHNADGTGIEAELGLHYLANDSPELTAANQFAPNSIGASASVVTGGLVPDGLQSDRRAVVFNDINSTNESREQGVSLRLRVPFAGFDLVSISGLNDVTIGAAADYDATSAPLAFFAGELTDKIFTQEFQLVSNRGTPMDWLMGVYFLDSSSAEDTLDTPSQTMPGMIDTLYNASDATAYAAFADATYHFNDAWALTAGGRYSREQVTHRPIRINGALVSARDSAEWNDFSPRLGLQYHWGENRLYATLSRGFKSGSFNLVNANDLAAVDPETLIAAEIGWKTRLPRHQVHFEAIWFNYDYTDLQVGFSESSASPGELQNADKAVVRGVDLTLTATPLERLNVQVGLSWLAEAEYQRYTNGSAFLPAATGFTVTTTNFSGNRMARTPELTYNIRLDYTQPLSAGRLVLGVGWYHSDSYFFSAQNTGNAEQPDFDLLNARVGFHTANDRWSVSAWGKNLSDSHYFCSKSIVMLGIIGCYGEPRTYGLEIAYQFRSQPRP